jgi:hypothetical protein
MADYLDDYKKLLDRTNPNWRNPTPEKPPESPGNAVTQFREGGIQGLLNLPESLGQLAERSIRAVRPGFVMPLHEQARNFRNRVESTPWGTAGEVAGSVLPSFIPGIGPAMDASLLARSAPMVSRGLAGMAQGMMSRPASSTNESFTQGAAGALAGAIGGGRAAQFVPPHIGHWILNLPSAAKHALGMALIRGAGMAPPRVAATAAGATTPREPQQ